MSDSHLVKTAEFAEMFRLSRKTVERRIRRGEIEAINVGTEAKRIYRIPRSEVERYERTLGTGDAA